MLSSVELEFELFCRGMRIDSSCALGADARRIARTRAGLGSGLEIVLRNGPKPIWVNVPVVERFAADSPLELVQSNRRYERMLAPAATLQSERGENGPRHTETVHQDSDRQAGIEDQVGHREILLRAGGDRNDLRHTPGEMPEPPQSPF